MPEAQLMHTNVIRDFVELEFSAQVGGEIQCALNREDLILHTTTVRNHAWGARLRQVILKYEIDTKAVGLCSQRLLKDCSKEESGIQGLTFPIPSVPQAYWRGKEKQVQIRLCVPKPCAESDFNLSYRITTIPESRDSDVLPENALVFESNMHVKL